MDYELAKELKDAGFPQGGNGGEIKISGELLRANGYEPGRYYCPTLSELIEACPRFSSLQVVEDENGLRSWMAQAGYVDTEGDTPEEAVARLWLALNRK